MGYNIKVDHKEIGGEGMVMIHHGNVEQVLTQDKI
jgi:hypothetical protein